MGLLGDVLDVVYPPLCLSCDAPLHGERWWCKSCELSVQQLPAEGCELCSEPGHHQKNRCERCRGRAKAFERAYAPLVHDGAVARAIHRFKYEDKPELAQPLAALAWQLARAFVEESKGVVVPVPLHEKRYRERKYDHAMLLAVELARLAQRKVPDEALVRVVDTPRQVGLTDEERVKNVQAAFWAGPAVKGEDVLLVDDVLTTGATAHAAATVLLGAGAKSVRVLSIARAVLRNT